MLPPGGNKVPGGENTVEGRIQPTGLVFATCDLGFSDDSLKKNSKDTIKKERIEKLDFIKIESFCSVQTLSGNKKTSHRLEKYLEKTYLIKDYYPKYTKTS